MTVTAMLNVDPASAEAPAPAAPPTADQAQDENDPVPSAVAAEDDPVPVAPTPAPVPRTFNCRAGRENCMVKGPAVAVPPVLGGVRRRREVHRDHAEVAVRRGGGGGDRGDVQYPRRRKLRKPQKWQCRRQRFLLQLGKFRITLLWILNKTKSLDLMEYIQEPSRRQEGHDGHA